MNLKIGTNSKINLLVNPSYSLPIIFIWFTFPFFLLGKYSAVTTFDNFEILVTGLTALSFGEFFDYWNRFAVSGTDVRSLGFATYTKISLFKLMPPWAAYQLLILSQFASSMLGTYLICRMVLKINPAYCLLPPILYGLYLDGMLIRSVAAYQPILIFSVYLLLEKLTDPLRWIFVAVIAWVISDTAYYSQFLPFPSLLIIGWFLFVDTRKRPIEWVCLIFIALALLSLRIEDFIALLYQSPLSQISLLRTLPSFEDIFSLPVILSGPINFFATLMLLVALLLDKSRPRIILKLALFILLAQLAEPVALMLQALLGPHLPFIRGFQIQRIFILTEFALWCSTAYSFQFMFQVWATSRLAGLRKYAILLPLIAMPAAMIYEAGRQKWEQAVEWITHGNYVHNFESPVIKKYKEKSKTQPWPPRVDTFQFYPTYLQTYGLETIAGYQPLYARRYYEFWSTLVEPWMTNSANQPDETAWWRISPKITRETNNWPVFRGVRMMLSPSDHLSERPLNQLYNLNLLSLVGVRWLFTRDRFTDQRLTEVEAATRPWSSLSVLEKLKISFMANFSGRKHLFVYENPDYFPRFYSPTRVRIFNSGKETLDAMSNSSLAELRNTLFVADQDFDVLIGEHSKLHPVKIKPVSYANDKIKLSLSASESGFIIGVNSYSPFWTALIDGKPTNVFPANHAFWGVFIEKGARELVFCYNPPYRDESPCDGG